jgi:hypothetical protein
VRKEKEVCEKYQHLTFMFHIYPFFPHPCPCYSVPCYSVLSYPVIYLVRSHHILLHLLLPSASLFLATTSALPRLFLYITSNSPMSVPERITPSTPPTPSTTLPIPHRHLLPMIRQTCSTNHIRRPTYRHSRSARRMHTSSLTIHITIHAPQAGRAGGHVGI